MCRGFAELRGRLREHPEVELGAVGRHVDLDLVATTELAGQDLLRQRVLDEALDCALQWSCAEALVVALLREEVARRRGELERELLLRETLLNVPQQNSDDLADVLLRQRVEHDHVIETVEELGVE